MEYTLVQTEDGADKGAVRLELSGDASVACASKVKDIFLETLEKSDNITICPEKITTLDISFFQLLCAFHKSALKNRKKLKLDQNLPAGFVELVRLSGFEREQGCSREGDESCFWAMEHKNG
ncbi:MAG: hypothetical protein HQM10_03050 [Candidatus Riflebacteria bacterium]|nr:hypothetical protein [Candidatus Riflebacteria bacterium]